MSGKIELQLIAFQPGVHWIPRFSTRLRHQILVEIAFEVIIRNGFDYHSHPAEINITSNLQSIETIRVRGWSKHTQYLDTYVKVLRKKFCSKFFLLVYLLTKMYLKKNHFGPRKFLKKFFFLFSFLFWPVNKQIADAQKKV